MYFHAVRLGNDVFASDGLVQVYHSKTWGWICDQQWDQNDADVVCRELGYTNALSTYSQLSSKHGNVWMNNVHCVGNETSLFLCRHDGWKRHHCHSSQLAGVVCKTPKGKYKTSCNLACISPKKYAINGF